jgi:hypothetical protein
MAERRKPDDDLRQGRAGVKRLLKRALPRLSDDLRIELGIVYAAGVLPFLGSLLRDAVVLSQAPLAASDLFFRFFYLSNLAAMVQGELIWTKYNSEGRAKVSIPISELAFLLAVTAAAGSAVYFLGGRPDALWALIPGLSVLVAYPIGILNGWKRYLASKVVSAAPSVLMAVLVLAGTRRLAGAYGLGLVLTLAGALALLAAGLGFRIVRARSHFRSIFHSILLTSVPFALFYLGNYLLLSLSGPKSPLVLWGNRVSNYIFTFLLLATPVFLNTIKGRTIRVSRFAGPIRAAAAAAALVLIGAALLRPAAPDWALILLNLDISLVSALAHYLVKIFVVRRLRDRP